MLLFPTHVSPVHVLGLTAFPAYRPCHPCYCCQMVCVRGRFWNHRLGGGSAHHAPSDPPRPSVTFFGTGGYVARGRDDVEGMYKAFCKRDGWAPFRFQVLEAHRLGSTLFVRYRFTSPKLARPYVGSDAYGTCGDKLVRIVSTFDESELKTRD